MHIHIERDDKVAKFWLDPISLQPSGGFSRREIVRIEKLLRTNHSKFIEAWHDYFGD